jgi:phenylacetate-CoA ligase
MFGLESLEAEAVYLRLPIPLQNLACSFAGWQTERTRYDSTFGRLLEEAIGRTYWSVEDTTSFRDHRLAALIANSVRTSPFYRERFRAAGISPSDIKSTGDLASLPILTKGEAQELARERTDATHEVKTRTVHTSGTTGAALRFPTTTTAIQEQWAVWWRYRSWHGIHKSTWCALFAGRSVVPSQQTHPPFWRVNHPGRQLLFSGYHMSPRTLPAYADELRRRRPPWLHGYPSLLALLAAYLLESHTDVGYDVRWITTGAENLLPHQASAIERAFGVSPLQHYGLTEGVANISECERGNLHVDEDFAAVEFVPLGQGDLHRVVGTNLTNPLTPLVRYDTQDLATIREGSSCGCGRPGRIVEQVDGRLEDYVVLRNGARIGRMDHIFKDMVNVQEAQIHQALPGQMTIRVVRGHSYGADDERALLAETAKRVGGETEINIEYVQSLPRSATGKLRFVISEVPGAAISESTIVAN